MSTFSIGQINQLGDSFEKAGFTAQDLQRLRAHPQFGDLKKFANGFARLEVVKHIIELDAVPFCPEGWKVESHHKQGSLEWDLNKVQLWLAEGQKDDKFIKGTKLQNELEGKNAYNANLLDYLLAHPELIPEEWKGKYIFFWGTIYRDSVGSLYMRYLYWRGNGWGWNYRWIGDGFRSLAPAALPQVS